MVDTSGQANIRGIDIQKLAVGFAEEEIIMRKFCSVVPTQARELRWYQKTAGFISATSTTAGTNAPGANVAQGASPNVIEQSLTRNTSNIKKWFHSSPIITDEDIKDSDSDIFATNVLDITRAVLYQEDLRIYNVLTESQVAVNINSVAAAAAWGTASYTGVNIIKDICALKTAIRTYGYNPEGAIFLLNPLQHQQLLTWLIDGKGSSIPSFASSRVQDGVAQELLGVNIVVSTIVVSGSCALFVPNRAVKVKEFTGLSTGTVEHVGIGKEIRVWKESEAILENPRAVALLTGIGA